MCQLNNSLHAQKACTHIRFPVILFAFCLPETERANQHCYITVLGVGVEWSGVARPAIYVYIFAVVVFMACSVFVATFVLNSCGLVTRLHEFAVKFMFHPTLTHTHTHMGPTLHEQ